MTRFYLKVSIYFFCFLLSLFGLNGFDYNRFIRQGRTVQAQVLYFIIACCLAYMMGSFLMAVIYYFN